MDAHPDRTDRSINHTFTALCIYALWCALAWFSDLLGQTVLSTEASIVLITGIVATNSLFFCFAVTQSPNQPSESTLAMAQCVFGIAWATVYALLSSGTGELVLGMYITAFFVAVLRLERRLLLHFTKIAVLCYALIVAANSLFGPPTSTAWPVFIQFSIFVGFVVWLLLFVERFPQSEWRRPNPDEPKADEQEPTFDSIELAVESKYAMKSFDQRYIIESLTREKGRTDRSNSPFSICIFDIDRFSALIDAHGTKVGNLVLKEFSKRVRAELRAMDTVNPTGIERRFGQFKNEEFVAILPNTALLGAERCAERIRTAIHKRPFEGSHELTISAGVAEFRRGETISDLLDRAESALRQAMKHGGNRIHESASKSTAPAQIIELHKLKS